MWSWAGTSGLRSRRGHGSRLAALVTSLAQSGAASVFHLTVPAVAEDPDTQAAISSLLLQQEPGPRTSPQQVTCHWWRAVT